MPETRDRLSREGDTAMVYGRRQTSSTGRGSISRESLVFVLQDEAEEGQPARTPFRWRGAPMAGTTAVASVGGSVRGRGTSGTPRTGRGGYFLRSPASSSGRENLSPMVVNGRARGRGISALPSWYPRKPLRDITAVARAIERREPRGRGEGLLTGSPTLWDRTVHGPSVSTSSAQLEHDISTISPKPTTEMGRCPPTVGKVPKILLDIIRKNEGDSANLTPQKKLLDNIDKVEKVVMDELRKVKRTPVAKNGEREKRVRTLMSMR